METTGPPSSRHEGLIQQHRGLCSAFDGRPGVSALRDDNVMCRVLIQPQSNIICSIFLCACSLRSIKLITVLSFGSGRAKRGEEGGAEGSKRRLMAF